MKNILQVTSPTELFRDMLSVMDFKLIEEKEYFCLVDLQGGNLGDIESDQFISASQLVERLDIYITDYFLNDLEEEFEAWCENTDSALWEEFEPIIASLVSCEDWVNFAENGTGHSVLGKFVNEYLFDFQVLYMICYDVDKVNLHVVATTLNE